MTTHTTKKIKAGRYEYRGYIIQKEIVAPWTPSKVWWVVEGTDLSSDTLTFCKMYVDRLIDNDLQPLSFS